MERGWCDLPGDVWSSIICFGVALPEDVYITEYSAATVGYNMLDMMVPAGPSTKCQGLFLSNGSALLCRGQLPITADSADFSQIKVAVASDVQHRFLYLTENQGCLYVHVCDACLREAVQEAIEFRRQSSPFCYIIPDVCPFATLCRKTYDNYASVLPRGYLYKVQACFEFQKPGGNETITLGLDTAPQCSYLAGAIESSFESM